MDLTSQEFWNRVTKLMVDHGITQSRLCDDLDLILPTFKNWKARLIWPEALIINKIAKYFSVTMEFLISGNEKNCLPPDISDIVIKLQKVNSEQRRLLISIINGQIDFWKNNS